ncbi:MAG: DUF1080 domain-containing protein [Abitibacteriaceae bacterium]|nr:DUF1080 domain-containing protein [Abditibacteriaceae bacterium]
MQNRSAVGRQLSQTALAGLTLLCFSQARVCQAQTTTPQHSGASAKAAATLQGHVEVAGQPLAKGWTVALLPQPTAMLTPGRTRQSLAVPLPADGKFVFKNVQAGPQYLCVFLDGRLDVDSVRRLTIEAGETRNNLVIKPSAPRADLEVHLLDAVGKPFDKKVRTYLFNSFGAVDQNPAGTVADANGVLKYGRLPAGHYDLWVEGSTPTTAVANTTVTANEVPGVIFNTVEVTSGQDTQRLDLTVPPAGATQGTLQMADGKTPAAGYTVAVRSATLPQQGANSATAVTDYARGARACYAQAKVGADGSFVLHGLTKGTHELDIRRPGERAPWMTIPVVPVTQGEAMSIGSWTVAKNGWQMMFDGKTLNGWKETDFVGRVPVRIENGQVILPMGNDMTGITWTKDIPRIDYEVSLEAMRVEGHDFFCGLTFPVEESPCSLILGGWGGGVAGLSSVNGLDASENETTKGISFESNRWYRVRLRVTKPKIEAWLDDEKIVDLDRQDKQFSIRIEVDESKPFGIATWRTTGAIRDIRIRRLDTSSTAP